MSGPDAGRSYPHDVTLTATFGNRSIASTVADAIAVESGEIADRRTSAHVERADDRVHITIRAADLGALRAGTKTWSGLLDVAVRTIAESGDP